MSRWCVTVEIIDKVERVASGNKVFARSLQVFKFDHETTAKKIVDMFNSYDNVAAKVMQDTA